MKKLYALFLSAFFGLLSVPALAQTTPAASTAIDLTPITSAFSAGAIITGVMAVAAVLASIYAAMVAAKMALRWIRGG